MKPASENERPFANEQPILVRPSRDGDVEAMLAIYRHHIRRGVEDSVGESGVPEPEDLRDRRKNFRNHRLPHLVACCAAWLIATAAGPTLSWCNARSGLARPRRRRRLPSFSP